MSRSYWHLVKEQVLDVVPVWWLIDDVIYIYI